MTDQLRQIPIVCPGHSRPLAELHYTQFTPEGFFLMSACHDKMPMLRHGETGDWVGTFEGHKGAVWSAKADHTAMKAATGSADFSAKYWDAITGNELHTFAHKHVVKSVEFSSDAHQLFTGGHEKKLRVFDLYQPDEPSAEFLTDEYIRKIAILSSSGTQQVVTGESKGKLTVWDIRARDKVLELQLDNGGGDDIMDIEASRNGRILTVAAGKHVYFYDTANSYALLSSFEMPISFKEEGGASLHPTQPLFIAGGSDTWVRVFNFETGKEKECHKGHHGPVRCLRYSPHGESFATGSEDGTIRIWQTDSNSHNATSVFANDDTTRLVEE